MVHARRQYDHVAGVDEDANPLRIEVVAHIEVSLAFEDESNLLVLVQVLLEEGLDLRVVVRQLVRRHGNDVVVLVAALLTHATELALVRIGLAAGRVNLPVEDTDVGERRQRDVLVRSQTMRLTLIN
jgi:hypothetical protein